MKKYIDEETALEYYKLGFDIFIEVYTVFKMSHTNSTDIADIEKTLVDDESNSRYYIIIDDKQLLN